jgi:hypothetical protein
MADLIEKTNLDKSDLSRPFGTGSPSALMADLLSAKLSKPADRKTNLDKFG